MSCFHPLKRFEVGTSPEGKSIGKVTDFSVQAVCRPFGSSRPWVACTDLSVRLPLYEYVTESQQIPCGHCLGCRMEYSRQWADRMVCEAVTTPPAYFWTLTYDPDHVPKGQYVDQNTGEFCESLTLDKEFFQRWVKRLRKHFEPQKVRFFACGEYGGKRKRPHYHMITFGLELEGLIQVKKSHLGYSLYSSPELLQLWSDPVTHENLGFVLVSDANWQTMAYVSRYVTKKLGKTKDVDDAYRLIGLEPEFAVMSRKPGLGREYYEQYSDNLFDFDTFFVRQGLESRQMYIPKYFSYLKEFEDPGYIQERKLRQREKIEAIWKDKLSKTDRTYEQILADNEVIFEARVNKLKRSLE